MNFKFTNPISEKTWKDRYKKGNETVEGNFRRVAKFVAFNEKEEEDFYWAMSNGYFFGGGRTTSNAGIGTKLTLNNCFCSPRIEDNLDDIFKKVHLGALTHQRGGGIGYDFSNIRPSGMPTSNDAIASGPVSFMDVFNAQTATILQGGRRGANMGILNIYHPDIITFIEAKASDPNRLNHFNLSVMVDDKFMEAVKRDETITLHFPVYDETGLIENDPEKWIYCQEYSAKELWDLIIRKAYDNGEPGVFFYDNLNKDNNLHYCERITTTNPCSEYVSGIVYRGEKDSSMYGGACNLGSLMLQNFVERPFTEYAYVNTDALVKTIKIAVRFLDNIIDKNTYPSEVYENYQKEFRTIGLGVTGLADMLVMLGYRYDSEEARDYVDMLMDSIALSAFNASIDLAEEKGPFPGYHPSYLDGGYLNKHCSGRNSMCWKEIKNRMDEVGIRNAKIMSIAPTGTMSLVFGNNCSSGIEPIFALEAKRKIKIGGQAEENIQEVLLQDYAYAKWKSTSNNCISEDTFTTALNISVDDHLKMLSVISKHVDMSVSKTINVPEEYTFEDTKNIYTMAHSLGIKGCTIFRPNALRPGVIFDAKKKEEKKEVEIKIPTQQPIIFDSITPISRKTLGTTHGDVYCKKCACGTLYITVACDDDGNLVETFVESSKGGVCKANTAAVNRLASLAMRSGVKISEIVDQLSGIDCKACTTAKNNGKVIDGLSCPDIIAKAIQEFYNNDEVLTTPRLGKKTAFVPEVKPTVLETISTSKPNKIKCPECGEEIIFEGGCVICPSCGWSKCS